MSRITAAVLFNDDATEESGGIGDLRERTAQGVLWGLVGNLGSRVLSTAVMVLLTRLLQPKAFGLMALATVIIMILSVMVDGGFAAALVQVDVLTRSHYDTAFWTSVFTGLAAAAIGLLSAEFVAEMLREPAIAPAIRWLTLILLISGLSSTPQAVLARQMKFRSLAIRLLFANLIGGGVGVWMALSGAGVSALVAQMIVKQIVQAAVIWWACPVRPGFAVRRATFGPMLRFGASVTGQQALSTLNRRSDDLLVGRYLGSIALGYYNVAYSLLLLLNQLLLQTIGQVAFPLFARLQNDASRMRSAMFEVARLASIFTLPVYVGVALMAKDIVLVAFGERWLPTVPVMQILATVGLPQTMWVFLGAMLIGGGKASWSVRINLLLSVLLVCGFLLTVQWGIVAVAASCAVSTFVFAPVQMYLVQRVVPYNRREYLGQFRGPVVGGLAMTAVIWPLRLFLEVRLMPSLRLVICVPVGMAVYLATVRLIARAALDEARVAVASVLPSRFSNLIGSR